MRYSVPGLTEERHAEIVHTSAMIGDGEVKTADIADGGVTGAKTAKSFIQSGRTGTITVAAGSTVSGETSYPEPLVNPYAPWMVATLFVPVLGAPENAHLGIYSVHYLYFRWIIRNEDTADHDYRILWVAVSR